MSKSNQSVHGFGFAKTLLKNKNYSINFFFKISRCFVVVVVVTLLLLLMLSVVSFSGKLEGIMNNISLQTNQNPIWHTHALHCMAFHKILNP